MEHKLLGITTSKNVYLNGRRLKTKGSKYFHTHSEYFDWGGQDTKAGQLQLALCIMVSLTGTYDGYHRLRKEVIERLPAGDFEITFSIPWKDEENVYRNKAMENAIAYNKFLSKRYLKKKPNEELICFVHPLDRDVIATALNV